MPGNGSKTSLIMIERRKVLVYVWKEIKEGKWSQETFG